MKNRKKSKLNFWLDSIPNWVVIIVGGLIVTGFWVIITIAFFGQAFDPYPTEEEYLESIGVDKAQVEWEERMQRWVFVSEEYDEVMKETKDYGINLDSFPVNEVKIIMSVAVEYGLSEHETALLFAIRKCENGRPGLEFGCGDGIDDHPARRYAGDFEKSLELQAQWCASTIKKRYEGDVMEFAQRYCPTNSVNWNRMVSHWVSKISNG